MPYSLDKLGSYLEPCQKLIVESFCNNDETKFELLSRKGVFLYEYLDTNEKLNETELPSKKHFYSKLNDETISENDYKHAQNVWETFQIKNLGEYSDLYLKTDILLLADIFENFRKTCLNIYDLDAAYYYTAPGLAFDAMLKYTGAKLELLTDIDMLLFIERGIRGGVSQCCHRNAKANNQYVNNFNSNLPTSYLMYFAVNNLYGTAICEYLPYGNFEWCKHTVDILTLEDCSDVG